MKRSLIFTICLLMAGASTSWAASTSSRVRKANDHFKRGEFDNANQIYFETLNKDPESSIVNYDLGTSLYKAGKYNESIQHLQKALLTEDPLLKQKASYNLGNAYYQSGIAREDKDSGFAVLSLEKALGHYEEAIKIDGKDKDAQFNYDFVQQEIARIKQKQTQSNESQPSSSDQQQQQQDKDKQQQSQDQSQDKPQDQPQQQEQQNQQNDQQQDQQENQQDNQSDQQQDDQKPENTSDQQSEGQPQDQEEPSQEQDKPSEEDQEPKDDQSPSEDKPKEDEPEKPQDNKDQEQEEGEQTDQEPSDADQEPQKNQNAGDENQTPSDYNNQAPQGTQGEDEGELTPHEAQMLMRGFEQSEQPQQLLNVFKGHIDTSPVEKDW